MILTDILIDGFLLLWQESDLGQSPILRYARSLTSPYWLPTVTLVVIV